MPSLVIGNRRGDRVRGLLRTLALSIGVLLLSLVLTYTAFRRWTMITPPSDHGQPLPGRVEVEVMESGLPRLRMGDCWMEERNGLRHLNLAGGPRVMGHAHGLLAGQIVSELDRSLVNLMDSYRPGIWGSWLRGNVMRWRYRDLPRRMPPHHMVELAALSRHLVETADLPERPFHRLAHYHALYDLTWGRDSSPFSGSSAFAIWGNQTLDNTMLVGRTFEMRYGGDFDEQKAVITFKPKGKIPFVSVAWPGAVGVYTGVNARGLFVAVNSARTDDRASGGMPAVLAARHLLENATVVSKALKILKKLELMSSVSMLVAHGISQRAVVVEKSPTRFAVRRSADRILATTNHFVDNKFKADASNDWLKRYTTSDKRYRRLRQLLRRFGGRMDVRTAAMVLRNRTGVDDVPLGLGNRNALDSLSATHAVVVDLSELVLWVTEGPHLLGKFQPIDLKAIFGMPVSAVKLPSAIDADSLYGSPRWKRYNQARRQLRHSRWLRRRGHLQRAMDFAGRAVILDPELPQARKLAGDLLYELGKRGEAAKHYQRFLQLNPPLLKEREEVKQRLGE